MRASGAVTRMTTLFRRHFHPGACWPAGGCHGPAGAAVLHPAHRLCLSRRRPAGHPFQVKVGGTVSGQRQQRFCFRRWDSGQRDQLRQTAHRAAAQPIAGGTQETPGKRTEADSTGPTARLAGQTRPALTAAERMRIAEIREKIAQSQKRIGQSGDCRNRHPQDDHCFQR